MFDFHEKRKLRAYLYSLPVIVALFLCAVFLMPSVYQRYTVERDMAHKKDVMAQELVRLTERAAVLEADVAHLLSERGIEEEIRDRYQVAKEGEQVVVILDDESNESATQTPQTEETTEDPWWRLW